MVGSSNLAQTRERIIDALVRTAAIVGIVAWVPSMIASVADGLWALAVADTVLYGWLLFMRFAPLTSKTRALHLTIIIEVVGVSMLVALGPFGYGIMWLLAGTVMAGMLLGARVGRIAILVQILAIVVVTVLAHLDPALWSLPAGGFVGWLAFAGSSLMLSAALSESIARLLEGLEAAHVSSVAAAKERALLERQLLRAQQLEAVGTLAGGIAHDFNNLLQPIVALTEAVRIDLGPDHPAAQDLDDVIGAANRARDLVRQMLRMSRSSDAETPPRAPIPLSRVAESFMPLLRASISPSVRLDLEAATDDVVNANEQEMQRVILNLTKNAWQAMPDGGGRIVIRVTRGVPADVADGALAGGAGFVNLDVEDDGDGMSEATLERIFEPYFTTKSLGEGTGLGLPLVRGIVHSMGGAVTVASSAGKGTRVRLSLPRLFATATT